MFVGTTMLSEFWDQDQEILFLGTWCLRYKNKQEWESLRYRVLPCPWDDRARFYNAIHYLNECGERMLCHLTDYLNSVHRVSYTPRYWRILLGPWLSLYLHALYDRYVHILEAKNLAPDFQTITLSSQCYRVPTDTDCFFRYIIDDLYNLQLYSQIFTRIGYAFPQRMLSDRLPGHATDNRDLMNRTKPMIKHLMAWGLHGAYTLLNGSVRTGVCDLYLPQSELWKLLYHTRFRVFPIASYSSFPPFEPVFDVCRNGLADLTADNAFEQLALDLLPHALPTLYLEGYKETRAQVNRLPLPPQIVSAIGWGQNEPFKFLAAEATDQGKCLTAIQHGGGYGILKAFPVEDHERQISDRYYVWGWADQDSDQMQNIPMPKLSSYNSIDRARREAACDILMITTNHPRYLYRFHSTPVGSQWDDYIEWQMRFVRALPQYLRQHLVLRLYPNDYDRSIRRQFQEQFDDIRFDGGGHIYDRIISARLVIVDHLMTTLLEAIYLDTPTVLFWDPQHWEVRKSAEPDINRLREAGILWHSPEEAAAHVAREYDHAGSWWQQEDIQAVRQSFLARYVLGRPDWEECWVQRLNSLETIPYTSRI